MKTQRETRPTGFRTEAEAASWDAYDALWDRYEHIADVLLPPNGYRIDPVKWREDVLDSLSTFGCDWLDHLMQMQAGNTVGDAVEACLLRLPRK